MTVPALAASMPAASFEWLRVLVAVGAPLAVLAGIAYAEMNSQWTRRALGSIALAVTLVAVAGVLLLVTSAGA